MNKRHINNPERTKRGKHRYSSFFILSSSLLLLLLAACTNDPSEDILSNVPGNSDLPQGTFVIDYTASTGDTRTRLAASERIQSLDYLLYEKAAGSNGFILKHRRTIPDINGNTVWPLTRETMTWAQREALKDTLNQSSDYKMVFVANADAAIWNNTEVLQNVTEGTSTFDNGRLVLPPRLFTDKDMYYMWSNHDAPLVGSRYNKDNPASMEITLQRMINKVEVKLDEEVVNGIASAGSVDTYVESRLNTIYTDKYMTGALTANVVENYMDDIATKMFQEAEDLLLHTTAEYKDKHNFALIMDNENNWATVVNVISSCSVENPCQDDNKCVRHTFISTYKELFNTHCDWSQASYIQLTYDINSCPYAIDFYQKAQSGATNYTLKINGINHADNVQDKRYTFYTFGNNDAANNGINKITSIAFYTAEATELFSIACNITPGISTDEQIYNGNRYLLLEYNPIDNIATSTDTETFSFVHNSFDLQTILGWNLDDDSWDWGALGAGWQKDDMNKWINSYFSKSEDTEKFTPYTLSLNMPGIVISAPWSTCETNRAQNP